MEKHPYETDSYSNAENTNYESISHQQIICMGMNA